MSRRRFGDAATVGGSLRTATMTTPVLRACILLALEPSGTETLLTLSYRVVIFDVRFVTNTIFVLCVFIVYEPYLLLLFLFYVIERGFIFVLAAATLQMLASTAFMLFANGSNDPTVQ